MRCLSKKGWTAVDLEVEVESAEEPIIKDANGNVLSDGGTGTVIKELKLKGTSSIQRGTIVKNIRLIHDPSDGCHDISCRIDGFGAMYLKSNVVKKSKELGSDIRDMFPLW